MLDRRESNITPSQSKITAAKEFIEGIVHLGERGKDTIQSQSKREGQRDKAKQGT
jgi:hypothetical protein